MTRALYIATLFCLLLLATACERAEALRAVPLPDLIGTWELRSSFGGWSGLRTYQAGNGNIISFTADTYTRFDNGVRETGRYKLVEDTSILTDQPITRIIFYEGNKAASGDDPFGSLSVHVDADTLTIAMDVYDGNSFYYQRIGTMGADR
ncbi:hypothetical protein ACXYMU_17140 [Pontibacter sp. CAU 1760]